MSQSGSGPGVGSSGQLFFLIYFSSYLERKENT